MLCRLFKQSKNKKKKIAGRMARQRNNKDNRYRGGGKRGRHG
jgi:hypothetical protein